MKYFPVIFLVAYFSASAQDPGNLQKLSSRPFSVGETVEVHSAALNEKRVLNIYLPEGYHTDTATKHPVIYLLDGSADEDFIHIAGLAQFCSFPWVNYMRSSIVVGIANTDRKRDLTFPTTIEKDKADLPASGGSENFIRFIEKELQPFITSGYRTDPVKTIIGQSLGGLLATEILLKKPHLFSHYIIVSPSLWWDNGSLLKQEPVITTDRLTVYIAVGKEGRIMERAASQLARKLKSDHNVVSDHISGTDHANILHTAVYRAFERIYR